MVKIIMAALMLFGVKVDETEVLIIETFAGEVFEAGSGDTCSAAMQGAVWPDDWRTVHCEKAYLVR